ncbi:unnamed protein product [Triticum turgidum subsp. durum]|uniref:Pectinesterase inhibitor domain-containing protein n=1 Tax=Triticum turgidum subsp. durum TaxID=4567 RepID=A0A9R0YYM5_TRITD|nr:unnamed protein product [Triticum turgidum subsp. durum]
MQPCVVLLLTLAILPSLVASTTSSLINTTCSKAPNVSYDHCVNVLSADPAGAPATDKRGLLIAAAQRTVHSVTSTVHIMSDLIQELNTCIQYYQRMGELTVGAMDDLRAGRDAGLIYPKLREASDEPLRCDTVFFHGVKKNLMEKENSENKNLAHLASSITFLLFNRRS